MAFKTAILTLWNGINTDRGLLGCSASYFVIHYQVFVYPAKTSVYVCSVCEYEENQFFYFNFIFI